MNHIHSSICRKLGVVACAEKGNSCSKGGSKIVNAKMAKLTRVCVEATGELQLRRSTHRPAYVRCKVFTILRCFAFIWIPFRSFGSHFFPLVRDTLHAFARADFRRPRVLQPLLHKAQVSGRRLSGSSWCRWWTRRRAWERHQGIVMPMLHRCCA